jgi:hypothetical protein
LICLAVATVVIVARFGYRVTGMPVRAPIAAPPAVGDCVLEAVDTGAFGGLDEAGKHVDYPHVLTATCPGARYAEVTAVVADGLAYRTPADGDVWADEHSPDRRCAAAADDYLGRATGSATPRWIPAVEIATGIIGPSVQAKHLGASWLACVVGSADRGSVGKGQTSYSGTLLQSMQTLRFPSQLGRCLTDLPTADSGFALVDCATSHRAEMLAWAQADPPTGAIVESMTTECPPLAGRLIGTDVAALGGRLDIKVVAVPLADTDAGQVTDLFCVAAPPAGHVLTGPLLGLGERPLPIR